ncbi:MAG TPA: DUF899 domain-containing protein [Streptosporangiaceae bacterium]|nr:DUF899 domain-containing protein [Streptosporangiaceae bacterium]
MSLPQVVSRTEWTEARRRLLDQEKKLTRQRDALNADRRRLPMVLIDKDYAFEGPGGPASLAELFGAHGQLIVQHVMFGPDWDAACPGCTAGVDEVAEGLLTHLHARDTEFVLVSRAPLAKLQAYATGRGWTVPWYSSLGSDFNYDFQVTLDKSRPQLDYNYRPVPDALGDDDSTELPGVSCFLRDGGQIYHTYSTFARGTDTLGSSYSLLDLTVLGRQEEWEEPKGRARSVHDSTPFFED